MQTSAAVLTEMIMEWHKDISFWCMGSHFILIGWLVEWSRDNEGGGDENVIQEDLILIKIRLLEGEYTCHYSLHCLTE